MNPNYSFYFLKNRFICIFLFFNLSIYAVNFEKTGITKLTLSNQILNSSAIFDVEIQFNLFDSRRFTTFIESQTKTLLPHSEIVIDVASVQHDYDLSIGEDSSAVDDDIKNLKIVFGCIKSLIVINKQTNEKANLYVYGDEKGDVKIFIMPESLDIQKRIDYFHLDFNAAFDVKNGYYNDCINNAEKSYPNGLHSKSYSMMLDDETSPAKFLHKIKTAYERYFTSFPCLERSDFLDNSPKINKFLFQIWIGTDPLPEEYKINQEKWLKLLPANWSYKLYTDKDVTALEFSSAAAKSLYEKLPNATAKADLLRMEILYKMGGIYVDLDTEPFEPLDSLLTFDFFALLYGPRMGHLFVDNYFIGSVPDHPIIKQVIENIVSFPQESSSLHPNLFTSIIPLTRAVSQHLGAHPTRDIVLPIKYFDNHSSTLFSFGIHYPKRLWKKK